jgi:dTDP-4-dehydrorhamnose reductase
MLRLGAERDELGVVADQVGCPTGARDIAGALKAIALRHMESPAAPAGVYHFVNAGEASWHDLAVTIFATASRHGLKAPKVNAMATAAYPTRAHRPANSRLDCSRIAADFGIRPRGWREAVEEIVGELLDGAKNPGHQTP